ncbi:MAG: acyl-CoA thioesterase [bacterium]|nr:acyl-CoA thioesterase [bacterium]
MARRTRSIPSGPFLEHTAPVRVRFQEVDSMGIVWHGHYLTYFEDARVALGRRFGIDYRDIRDAGLLAPVVHTECDYMAPATYGDELDIVARLYREDTPKIEFTYCVFRRADGEVLATGRSTQVFTDPEGELYLTMPDFLRDFYARTESDLQESHE